METDIRRWRRVFGGIAAASLVAVAPAAAQSPDTNVFLAVEGADWGQDQPALEVSDRHCRDLAYAAGMGDGRWRAYLDGTEADGEGDQVARERIGEGPFINYHGTVVAESVDELHSDASELSNETLTAPDGSGPVPEAFLEIPPGSDLDGSDFSREGPYLCFKVG